MRESEGELESAMESATSQNTYRGETPVPYLKTPDLRKCACYIMICYRRGFEGEKAKWQIFKHMRSEGM